MRSIGDLYIGVPKTTRNNFWPRIAYSLYDFYAATMTIKSRFILDYPHIKAVFGRKQLSPVKIGPQNGGFSGILGLKY